MFSSIFLGILGAGVVIGVGSSVGVYAAYRRVAALVEEWISDGSRSEDGIAFHEGPITISASPCAAGEKQIPK
jgi:hypothetical protein